MICLEEVTTPEGLVALREDWSSLWERCKSATPFQSPEWLIPWWQNLFNGGELWVLALRRAGRLAGLAPLFIHGQPSNRQVAMLGAGVTDYLDLLLEPDIAPLGVRMILDHLAEHRSRWDLCDFEELRTGSELLCAPAPPGLQARTADMEACPVLELPASMEELQARMPAKFRLDLRRARNRLEKSGQASFETACQQTLPEHLEALFRLHAARWNLRNEPGVLATSPLQQFHRQVAAGLLLRGCLRSHVLRFGSSIAAVVYSFASGDRVYAYLGGFEPGLARYSPGTVLMAFAIEQAIAEKIGYFDFLRHRDSYKYLWGARDQINHRLLLWHSDASSAAIA